MKLVTGIEAIQSGKRFRYVFPQQPGSTIWLTLETLKSCQFLYVSSISERQWEIEQEPREFWIQYLEEKDEYLAFPFISSDCHAKYDKNWIRVREVIE